MQGWDCGVGLCLDRELFWTLCVISTLMLAGFDGTVLDGTLAVGVAKLAQWVSRERTEQPGRAGSNQRAIDEKAGHEPQ